MPTEPAESQPNGWNAIDAACKSLYGEQEPQHWGPALPPMFGGDDPLQGISAYACDEPRHWHFVTYGFSELYEKECDNPEVSGFGSELTLRLARNGDESQPPAWCLNFLQNLARYVFRTANRFEPGHHMDLNGPIALGSPTRIKAIAFMEDLQLGSIETPNGRVQFLQVVGITTDELKAIKRWDTTKFLDLLKSVIPLGLTDLGRDTVLSRPEIRQAVEEGCVKDGSSTAALFVGAASWQQTGQSGKNPLTTLILGANGVRDFGPVLKGRIPHGESLMITAPNATVFFEPAAQSGVEAKNNDGFAALHVRLTASDARVLADLVQPKLGTYELPGLPDLRIVVERTEIKDRDGNVIEVIG